MVQQAETWCETVITEQEFSDRGQKLEAWDTAKDFLQLIANGTRPEVVFVTEGYHKQQPLALNFQLPELERIADTADLKEPPQLVWSCAANMLSPTRLLSRELTNGGSNSSGPLQQRPIAAVRGERMAFGVVERCKLLDVQYILKQYVPQQDGEEDNPFREQLQEQPGQHSTALTVRLTMQRLHNPQQQLLQEAKQEHNSKAARCCAHAHESEQTPEQPELQQYCSCSATDEEDAVCCQKALVCTMEYPVLHLEGNDYIVSAAAFDRGMADWSQLAMKEEFTMLWDGSPFVGFVEGYRQRTLQDPFWGSPWRSIVVDWKGNPVNREEDPEDWQFGNPWEMQRLEGAASRGAGRRLLDAPWTPEGTAAALAAARAAAEAEAAKAKAAVARAAKKRKRSCHWSRDDHFYYEASSEDGDVAEFSESSFYYDDDPDDFTIHSTSRRQTQRQRSQRQQRNSVVGGGSSRRHSSPSDAAVARAKQKGEAVEGEPAHSWGRDLVGVPDDVCLICRKGPEKGELVNKHTGHSYQNCCRRYHIGCLLLLNAAGIRTVYLGKQQLKKQQQQQRGSRASSGAAAAVEAAAHSSTSDGLLGELQHLLQQPEHNVSPALAAAVAEAEAAAALYHKDEVSLSCPAHCCHGCGLNGKHEFLVWCCCCWVRTYHCRNCIPMGAEKVVLNGREYIRCPYCVAAKAPLPLPATSATAVAAAAAASPASDEQGVEAPASEAAAAVSAQLSNEGVGAPGLAAAAAAAAAIQAELTAIQRTGSLQQRQQQQFLVGSSREQSPVTTLEHVQSDQHAAQPGAQLQQQQQDLASDSHAHTPDTFNLASEDVEHSLVGSRAGAAWDIVATTAATAGITPLIAPPPATAALQQAMGATQPTRVTAHSNGQHHASDTVGLQLLEDEQQLAALQREIEGLQEQLRLKQQLYEQKEQQLQHKRQSLLKEHQQQQQQQHIEEAQPASLQAAAAQHDGVELTDDDVIMGEGMDASEAAALSALGMLAAEAEAEDSAAAEAAVGTAAAAAAVQSPDESNIAAMPSWLLLGLEDAELHSPSYSLVPVEDEDGTAAVLQCVAEALACRPDKQVGRLAAAGPTGSSSGNSHREVGLPLVAPHVQWLIGDREKAENAKYKVSGSWAGCPVIHVDTPDEGVFGVCIVMDYSSYLPQQHQQLQLAAAAEGKDASGTAVIAAAPAARQRPDVYLRCWRNVAQDAPSKQKQQRRQQQQQDEDEKISRRGLKGDDWQVMVNGRSYPSGLGKEGLHLQDGDVITVQGMKMKLVANA